MKNNDERVLWKSSAFYSSADNPCEIKKSCGNSIKNLTHATFTVVWKLENFPRENPQKLRDSVEFEFINSTGDVQWISPLSCATWTRNE